MQYGNLNMMGHTCRKPLLYRVLLLQYFYIMAYGDAGFDLIAAIDHEQSDTVCPKCEKL